MNSNLLNLPCTHFTLVVLGSLGRVKGPFMIRNPFVRTAHTRRHSGSPRAYHRNGRMKDEKGYPESDPITAKR